MVIAQRLIRGKHAAAEASSLAEWFYEPIFSFKCASLQNKYEVCELWICIEMDGGFFLMIKMKNLTTSDEKVFNWDDWIKHTESKQPVDVNNTHVVSNIAQK